ncbi:MAG TPA: ABC transporter ATP-binding protein [Acetobacteraceae bacterium]|nr:ABC transporter ATP-binding protein [Acetobacteraceae bacterium]
MSARPYSAAPLRVFGFLAARWARQPRLAATIVALIALGTLADVATPIYAGRLVDAVTMPSRALGGAAAVRALIWLGALGLTSAVLYQLAYQGIVRFTLTMMTQVKAEAFAHVQEFSAAWHADSFSGSVVRQILRGASAIDVLNDVIFFGLLPTSVILVGVTAVLGWRWELLGVAVAAGMAVYLGLTVALSLRWVAPAAELANQWDSRLSGALADAITCNAAVRSFAAEARESARFGGVLGKWGRRTWRAWMRGVTSYSLQSIALVLLQVLITGTAALLWWRGRASAGDVAMALGTYFVLHGYLRDMSRFVREMQRGVADMQDLVALSAAEADVRDRPGAPALSVHEGRIEARAVTFGYGAHAAPLFRDLSVTIVAGERVGLVGPSGSGKSSFVRLVQRLHDLQGGKILIDGQDIAAVTQASLRAHIAMVPQDPALFHRTLAENIAYGRPDAPMADIEHAARLARAHEFIIRQPKGYATLVGERGIKLSGGERQRVAIARAFLADRKILILDEATSSLDSESEAAIAEAAERLMAGRTCLVIAHRLSTVRAMDRILVFDAGRIVEEGTHAMLVQRRGGLYRNLFERQALGLVDAA